MWVMISGITQVEDAWKALHAGVDALGLVVERQAHASENGLVSPEVAMSITQSVSSVCEGPLSFRMRAQQECRSQSCSTLTNGSNALSTSARRLESFGGCVLVTHLTDVQEILRLADIIGVTTIQLVGNTTPEDVTDIKNKLPYIKIIKSLCVFDDSCIEHVRKYIYVADTIELDTIDIATKQIGGTGKTHDWNISKKIVQEFGHEVPIILAGGLRSDNIEDAIQRVGPVGVDVSSSVKDNEGFLDDEKLTSFIYKAKHCTREAINKQSAWSLIYC